MRGNESVILDRREVDQHPAARAWARVGNWNRSPSAIHRIWEKKKGAKSTVYRLLYEDSRTTAIIAKRILERSAVKERLVYENILPALPVTALRYYGFLEEGSHGKSKFCWLFLEDAGDGILEVDTTSHVSELGKWLGALHMSAIPKVAAEQLPILGFNFYWGRLETAQSVAEKLKSESRLPAKYRDAFARLVANWRIMGLHRRCLEKLSSVMPNVFVHGDIQLTNVRIRLAGDVPAVLPFDWVACGLGTPATDLQFFSRNGVTPESYWRVVSSKWPGLALSDVVMLSDLGRIFRTSKFLYWSTVGYRDEWKGHYPCHVNLDRFAMYESRMNDQLQAFHRSWL